MHIEDHRGEQVSVVWYAELEGSYYDGQLLPFPFLVYFTARATPLAYAPNFLGSFACRLRRLGNFNEEAAA